MDEAHVRQLIQKYQRSGPRYTSYPTAPEWNETITTEDFQSSLSQVSKPISLYVHIPFCEEACYFCGCNMIASPDKKPAGPYLECLHREITMVAESLGSKRKLIQLHFGGGTPTYLSTHQLRALLETIQQNFTIDEEAEAAIEVDPRVTTDEQLELLARFGFNRISMGVQDFDLDVQESINRVQTLEQTAHVIEEARQQGINSINVDLMYGLPHQTTSGFAKTVAQILKLSPDRIALFNYAHLPQMLPFQKHIKDAWIPDGHTKFQIFWEARQAFLQAGYEQIGFDHFAKPEDELARARERGNLRRNFQGYTVKPSSATIGVGTSAISDFSDLYVQNIKLLKPYYRAIRAKHFASMRGKQLSVDDQLRRQVIMQLLCNFSLSYADLEEIYPMDFKQTFAAELAELSTFEQDGLLEIDSDGMEVTELGQLFIRNICICFDRYLQKQRTKQPQFSKTV